MKKWGIVGALLFVAACVVGFIFNFDGSDIVAIGLATFGLTATVIAFVRWISYRVTAIACYTDSQLNQIYRRRNAISWW